MKVLTNTVGSFITGSDIADSVMTYGLALAENRQSDIVDIPFLDEDGDESRMQMRVGWRVDVTAREYRTSAPEILDAEAVRSMSEKESAIRHPRAGTFSPQELHEMSLADEL